MIHLFKLIEERKFLWHKYSYLIFEEKRKLHNQFVKVYHKWCIAADTLFILALLMNFGALFITNIMVAREIPQGQLELREANPVQARINNFKMAPITFIFGMITFVWLFGWVILTLIYGYHRLNLMDVSGLYMMYGIIVFLVLVLGLDFLNNLGYFIGWSMAK